MEFICVSEAIEAFQGVVTYFDVLCEESVEKVYVGLAEMTQVLEFLYRRLLELKELKTFYEISIGARIRLGNRNCKLTSCCLLLEVFCDGRHETICSQVPLDLWRISSVIVASSTELLINFKLEYPRIEIPTIEMAV
jgi:hypothetical protein